jgi:endonuclease YncB( thermonuclease family)
MRRAAVVLAAVAAVAAGAGATGTATGQSIDLAPGGQLTSFTARVVSVVSSETVKVRTARGRIRIIKLAGVESPVIRPNGVVECGALQALDGVMRRAFTHAKDTDGDGLKDKPAGHGRVVIVTTEPGVSPPRGRTVAYVEPKAKGVGQINVVQILNGWAKVDRNGSLSQGSNLAGAEQVAKSRGSGAWGACGGFFHADGSLQF